MSNPGARSTHRSAISASSASLSAVQSLVPTSNGMACSVLVQLLRRPFERLGRWHGQGPHRLGGTHQDTGRGDPWPTRRPGRGPERRWRPLSARADQATMTLGPRSIRSSPRSPRRLSTLNSAGRRRTDWPTWRKTGSSPGCSESSCLSRSTTGSVRTPRGSSTRSSPTPSAASWGRCASMHTSFTWSSLVSSRPRTTNTASSASSAPISAMTLGKTNTSIEARRSSRTKVAMSSPRLV